MVMVTVNGLFLEVEDGRVLLGFKKNRWLNGWCILEFEVDDVLVTHGKINMEDVTRKEREIV